MSSGFLWENDLAVYGDMPYAGKKAGFPDTVRTPRLFHRGTPCAPVPAQSRICRSRQARHIYA